MSSYKDGIFLSGLWRSGSTYIWSEFRKLPNAYCFYEPLNQGLGRLNKKRINRYNPEVTKVNTHPVLEKPYFAEFEPLMQRRGVRGFKRRFAYDRYAMDKNDNDTALKNYIHSLCNLARENNATPVLGFNQVMFRMPWLRKNFDALHVHIDRSPRDIWSSYSRLTQHGNYTYFLIWLTIIEHNKNHPLFASLAEKFRLRTPLEKIYLKPKKFYRNALENITPQNTYFMVFYLWCATALHALSYADQIIDINRSNEDGYAASCAAAIYTTTGLKVDFSKMRGDSATPDEIDFSAIENDVFKIFPVSLFDRAKIMARMNELQSGKAELLGKLF